MTILLLEKCLVETDKCVKLIEKLAADTILFINIALLPQLRIYTLNSVAFVQQNQ